jgi:hypothetical protein
MRSLAKVAHPGGKGPLTFQKENHESYMGL